MNTTSRKISALIFGCVALSFSAQEATAQTFPTDDPVIRQMWDEGMGEGSQIYDLAQTLLDSIGPRLTGTPGYEAAARWIESKYAAWGVATDRQNFGSWPGWERGYTHIDLLTPRKRDLEGTLLGWSPGTDGPVEADVVILPLVSDAAEFEAWLPNVAGKIVAISFPEPSCRAPESWEAHATPESMAAWQQARNEGQQAWFLSNRAAGGNIPARLEEAGAVAVLSSRWSVGWGADKVFTSPTNSIPGVHLSCEDYGLVARLAQNNQGPRIRLDAQAEFTGDVPLFNVIGRIPGTELPDEYVVLSAHLDSYDGASGATDNGSGTLMMLEAMRILKETYPNPRRTIVVGHWAAEEQGLVGSSAFAWENPEVIDGLQAAFNQDNGTWRVDYIRMQGFTGAGAHFARWFSALPQEITGHIELDIPGIPERGGSDHMSFICRPAPGFRLQSNYPDYRQYTWHTNKDTFDKLIFDDLKNNATLAAMLAYQASEDLARVPSDTRVLPINPRTGEPGTWPGCSPIRRGPRGR
jgi:hypothetical protein